MNPLTRRFRARLQVEALEDRFCPANNAFTAAVFDPNTATWYFSTKNQAGGGSVISFQYGWKGVTPVMGDWNGDGTTDIGVFDPNTAKWYLRAFAPGVPSPGNPTITPFAYGWAGAMPVTGHWAGGLKDGVGVFDPNSANWFLRNTTDAGGPDETFLFGFNGATPVTGDWDNTGKTSIGIFDSNTATWYERNNAGGGDHVFQYGWKGVAAVTGDWDGNGTTTIGVVDPLTATWYLRNSNSAGNPDIAPFAFGWSGVTFLAGNWDGANP